LLHGRSAVNKETIRELTLAAGFTRARFLAPFVPFHRERIPNNYRIGAPSLLVTALPYGNQRMERETISGVRIAPFARRNYYREAVKRLQTLGGVFRSAWGGAKADYRILCNSPVPEKPLAAASGLGALGRNGLIITPEAGSLIIIAAMTLPFALVSDTSLQDFSCCDACDPLTPSCVRACPTGAVRGDGTLDLGRCIQWYASGHGDCVPPEVLQNWGNRLYGCTPCQDGCIYNQRPIPGVESAEGFLPASLDPQALLSLSDRELKARFKGTCLGLSWLSATAIRTSIACCTNSTLHSG
jgi:epoxyqueuosine reductase